MTLYTYCIPVDDGAAPNPFWGKCTLAICKPVIRRNAKPGDWVAGTGSAGFGFANTLVYAMKVGQVIPFDQYDAFCKRSLNGKIPDMDSADPRRHVGDCIYDFETKQPVLRKSVHGQVNMPRDLRGKNVLIADEFYYFGSKPKAIPDEFLMVVKQGQAHKSTFNNPYKDGFVKWITGMTELKNKILADPYGLINYTSVDECAKCSIRHCAEDDLDEQSVVVGY